MSNSKQISKDSKTSTLILKYIGAAVAVVSLFWLGWSIGDAYKGDIIHVEKVFVTDTLYIAGKLPETITKTIYVDKPIYRIDTVHTTKIIERTVEYAVHDTIYLENFAKRMVLSQLINDSVYASIYNKNLLIPQTFASKESREWWEDLIYLTGTVALTYGVSQIK